MFQKDDTSPCIFAYMTHRGKLLEQAIRQSGIPVKEMAEYIGVSRNKLYDIFKREHVELDILLKVGKRINRNIIYEIPEIRKSLGDILSEPRGEYISRLDQCKEELFLWMRKYATAMEKVQDLMNENIELRRALGE